MISNSIVLDRGSCHPLILPKKKKKNTLDDFRNETKQSRIELNFIGENRFFLLLLKNPDSRNLYRLVAV